MFKNLNIYCQGWQFDTTDEDEANFFSGVSKSAITERIDLKDFLLLNNDLKLKRNFNTTDTGYNGRNNLYFETSNIDLKLSDLEGGHGLETSVTLSTFFMLFDDTRFIKWKVEILNSGSLVWQGIVYQEGIKENFTQDNDNKTLEVLCLGWETEFKEYYSNKALPYYGLGTWSYQMPYTPPGGIFQWLSIKGKPITMLLGEIMPITMNFQSGLSSWFVADYGFLFISLSTEKQWLVKEGYQRIASQETCYGFLEKICNAMGWVWFFSVVNGEYSLTIKQRGVSSGLAQLTIPYEDFIRWEVTKHPKIVTYDYVIILDGTFLGGNLGFPEGYSIPEIGFDHRGERMAIITDKLNVTNESRHWSYMEGEAGSEDYVLKRNVGYKFSKYAGETDDNFNISVHTRGSTVANSTIETYTLPKDKILFVNGGDAGQYFTGCYMDNTSNFLWETGLDWLPMTHPMLLFKGCYGSMLFQHVGGLVSNTWTQLAQTDEWKNNFRPFLNSRLNRQVTIRVKDLITDPLQYIEVTGYNGEPFASGNKWAITSMETDLLNDITELQLSSE